jgi:hypothetical protein
MTECFWLRRTLRVLVRGMGTGVVTSINGAGQGPLKYANSGEDLEAISFWQLHLKENQVRS